MVIDLYHWTTRSICAISTTLVAIIFSCCRIELALWILEPGKNWNINETFWFNAFWVSITTKKSWRSLKIGRILFEATFQDGRHRPFWKRNFWYTGPTSVSNMSFLTNVMVTNPFPMLILHSEVYLTLYAA